MQIHQAEYNIGQVIFHKHYNFRGVIVDVDAEFSADDEWYNINAKNHPPKDRPWYHVLVDDGTSIAYVSEQNISSDLSDLEVHNPLLLDLLGTNDAGEYISIQTMN